LSEKAYEITGALSDHGFINFQTGSLATDSFTGLICLQR
jgi:hypothetical protein